MCKFCLYKTPHRARIARWISFPRAPSPASRCDETFIMMSPRVILPLSSMIRLIFLNININCEFHTLGQVLPIPSYLRSSEINYDLIIKTFYYMLNNYVSPEAVIHCFDDFPLTHLTKFRTKWEEMSIFFVLHLKNFWQVWQKTEGNPRPCNEEDWDWVLSSCVNSESVSMTNDNYEHICDNTPSKETSARKVKIPI